MPMKLVTPEMLKHLQTNVEWRDTGLTVGEPVTRLSVSESGRDPETALINEIRLGQVQAVELFALLERNAAQIEELVETKKAAS